MYKAPQSTQPIKPQMYEYRVELINHLRPSQMVFRVYQSEFEVGECWGYNRFYRIDQLESEGYLSNDLEDCIYLKYYVRPPNYHILAMDQLRYINDLEKKSKDQEADLMQARRQIQDLNKKQKKQKKSRKDKGLVSDDSSSHKKQKEDSVPRKLKIKNMFSNPNKDEEMPRSSGSGSTKRENSNGSKEEQKAQHRKLLDDEISKGDIKMRAALDSYLSVSESDGDNHTKKEKESKHKSGGDLKAKCNKSSSSGEKDLEAAAALYSGMISHSDTSEAEDDEELRISAANRNNEDREEDIESAGDKEIGNELDDDPEFMASDTPPDEF